MSQLGFLFLFVPALVTFVVASALLYECQTRWRPSPLSVAEKRAMVLLRSWLTPEQDKQWATHRAFEVIGCDTGSRYRITYAAVMNVYGLYRKKTFDYRCMWQSKIVG
jgi:hypothetical protein